MSRSHSRRDLCEADPDGSERLSSCPTWILSQVGHAR
jgi:hypothetical protein